MSLLGFEEPAVVAHFGVKQLSHGRSLVRTPSLRLGFLINESRAEAADPGQETVSDPYGFDGVVEANQPLVVLVVIQHRITGSSLARAAAADTGLVAHSHACPFGLGYEGFQSGSSGQVHPSRRRCRPFGIGMLRGC